MPPKRKIGYDFPCRLAPAKNLKSSFSLPLQGEAGERGFGGNSARPTNLGRNLFEFFRTHTANWEMSLLARPPCLPAGRFAPLLRGWLKVLPTIAKNIKKYRQKQDISQDKLSKLADIAYNVIIKIESGATPNPTIETMAKIAKGLGVSIDDLIKE
ncbi:MAG: Transcriptional regulator, XRE family [Parcubacteria group bacterium GW2011_GWB1_46_8]|nr:MAG: Transcriptional regulator, XRE family [Parcubacteria group bacterium GW2011_GWB1_46_8]